MALSAHHISLIADLRWQVLRNSMRFTRKRFEFGLRIFIYGMVGLTGVAVGVLFFVIGWKALPSKPQLATTIFWFLFAFWMLFPLLMEGGSPSFNFRELARYPIRYRTYFSMSALYGFLDPSALACCVWLIFFWVGTAVSMPLRSLWIGLVLLMFIAVNLFSNRVVFGWLERLTSTRKGRERIMITMLAAGMAWQLMFLIGLPNYDPKLPESPTKRAVQASIPYLRAANEFTPPGLAAAAVRTADRRAVPKLLGLLIWVLGLGYILHRQLRKNFLGESPAESFKPVGAVQSQPGWKLPGISEITSAVMEKELRYVVREPKLVMNMLIGWSFLAVIVFSSSFMRTAFNISEASFSRYFFPGAMAYCLMLVAQQAFNIFWSDSPGFSRWLVSGASLRQVIIGKNLSLVIVLLVNALVVGALALMTDKLSATQIVFIPPALLYAAGLLLGGGNILSVWFPKKVEQGKLSSRTISESATLASLGVQAFLATSLWFVYFVAVKMAKPGAAALVAGVLLAGAVLLYLFSIAYSADHVKKQLDKFHEEFA